MSISAMKQALEALEWNYGTDLENIENCTAWLDKLNATISALRQAIAEAEKIVPSDHPNSHQQEPFAVAWVLDGELFWPSEYEVIAQAGDKAIPLYTAPVHASDISQKPVDETAKDRHEFEEMAKKGTKAWADTPDDWVDELRGGADMSDYDKSIHGNPDAQAWAKFFIDTIAEQSWRVEDIDEGLMTGWFANAMMAMHDHVKREWVGLTDEERGMVVNANFGIGVWEMARAIEAKLKEKNS